MILFPFSFSFLNPDSLSVTTPFPYAHVFRDVESKMEREGEWGNLDTDGRTVTGSYLKGLVKTWGAGCNDALLSVQSSGRGLQCPSVGPFEILVVDFDLRHIIREAWETILGVRPLAHYFDHDSHTLDNFFDM